MNMQSEDNIEKLFRERLTDFQELPSDTIDHKILDSIIDHSAKQSKWSNVKDYVGKSAIGVVVGVALTTVAFLTLSENDDTKTDVAQASLLTGIEETASESLVESDSRTNENVTNTLNSKELDYYSHKNKSALHLENNASSSRTSQKDNSSLTASSDEDAYNKAKLLRNNRNSIKSTNSNPPQHGSRSEFNPEVTHNFPLIDLDNSINSICYTNVGFPTFNESAFSNSELQSTSPSLKATLQDRIKRKSIEVYAGIESYSQKDNDDNYKETDISNLSVLYNLELQSISLKTGVSLSKYASPTTYEYSYLQEDTIGEIIHTDSLDADGNKVTWIEYDTETNTYNGTANSTHQKYRVAIPLLVGMSFDKNRFTAGIYGGVIALFDIAETTSIPNFPKENVIDNSPKFKNTTKFNSALMGQVEIGYWVTNRLQLIVNGEYKTYQRSFLETNNTNNKPLSTGVNVGLKLSL